MVDRQPQVALGDRFAERRRAVTPRSSALVPVHVAADVDTWLVFFDYWQIKNGLRPVTCHLRVFDEGGRPVHEIWQAIRQPHNHVSFGALLGRREFRGMAEIEILSAQNLVFHFPALAVFYRSGRHFGAVHASGRVRNGDESIVPSVSTETNWPCRVAPDVVPFVHFFNGPCAGGLGRLPIRLMASSSEVLAEREVDLGLHAPYASRLVLLDELFDLAALQGREFFMAIDLPDAEFYPRLVAGNFHRSLSLLEASHSFYWSTLLDYVGPADDELTLPSFVPLLCPPELELEILSFPTNAPAHVEARVRRAAPGERLQATGETVAWTTGGPGARPWRYSMPGSGFTCLDLPGRTPSRLNASYLYQVRGAPHRFRTAVAWGAYAHPYPPRRSHWGPGLVSADFETVVMVRNVAHRARDARPAAARLTVYDERGLVAERELVIPAEAARFVSLRELLEVADPVRSVSWFLRSENPHLDTFWTSFAPDGSVCADHGF